MYQQVGTLAYKVDLSNTIALADYLENPERLFKSVHVAGTNGKGSTSHMLASVLQEAGYKVGLYTSPHLKDFRERIKINGEQISKRSVSSFVTKHQDFFKQHQLSFFEMTVGLAFHEFAKQKVDVAIIEVGLGGRLDSTNIITPEVSVITNIGLDHTQFLGNTIAAIAKEKGGVIKGRIPVVIGETTPETKIIFKDISTERKAPILFSENEEVHFNICDLKGNYQHENQRTAQVVLNVLDEKGFHILEKHRKKGFGNVIKNTGLLGRWQLLQEQPLVICDTAHNSEGLTRTMEQLKNTSHDKLHIVFGVVGDKDLDIVLPILPKNAHYYFCEPSIYRALSADLLQEKAAAYNLVGNTYKMTQKALRAALKNANLADVIYVGGSTFVVAEVV